MSCRTVATKRNLILPQRLKKNKPCAIISICLLPQVPSKFSCNRQKHIHVCSSTSPTSPSSLIKTHLILLFESSNDTETSKTPFGISPPARKAEFGCCFIEGRDSYGSEFSCWNGKRWELLEKGTSGTVLYPLHETCIEIVRRVAQYNRSCNAPYNTVDYTSLQGYYEALLRLHDRLTSWPWDDPDAEEQLSRFHPYPTEYGSYKLEWEHQYYGAARFADGSGWDWAPEWEV